LLDSDYLSLAEVQVMGVDPLHFAEMDYSSVQNDFDGHAYLNKSWYSHYQRVHPKFPLHPTPQLSHRIRVPLPPLKPMAQSRHGVE
jgi:hypothetical protein